MSAKKLPCYIDESGQDTKGVIFLVSVIITEDERDEVVQLLEKIEQQSEKGRVKWMEAKDKARVAYIKAVLGEPKLKGCLNYAIYHNNSDYWALTVLTTARAILACSYEDYQASIFVDGLPKTLIRAFATELRHLHIRTKKVRGVKKDENNALIRLADALCGFVRAAKSGRQELETLLEKAKVENVVREV
jgi:hypothetical protein